MCTVCVIVIVSSHFHDTLNFHLYKKGDTKAESRISLEEVASEAGISNLDVFDEECSQTMLLNLAKHCVDWRLIGLYLDLTKSDIAAVDEDYRTADEKRAGMLGRWKEKFAFKAKYGVFIEALLACGKTQDAVDACKTIAKGQHISVRYLLICQLYCQNFMLQLSTS